MKSTLKKIAITTSLCSALVLSMASLAADKGANKNPPANGKHHQQMSEEKLSKISQKLGLSTSQEAQFKVIKAEEKTKMQALKPAMDAFREQVKVLMSAESFDEPAFIQLQESNQDVFAAMALIKVKSKFAMKSVLTQEQQEKFRSMKHKHKRSRR